MSLRYSNTTADYLEWSVMLSLIRRLFNDGNYRMSLFIGAGSFFGLRVSDLKKLTWSMLLDNDSFVLIEQKTGKKRNVKINRQFQRHIEDCCIALNVKNRNELCFLSQKGTPYSTQRLNVILKDIRAKYNIKINHFSCHSLRKTFGRKVVDNAGEQAEMALIKLSEIFNHATPQITRRYLGLRQQEINEVYDGLDF